MLTQGQLGPKIKQFNGTVSEMKVYFKKIHLNMLSSNCRSLSVAPPLPVWFHRPGVVRSVDCLHHTRPLDSPPRYCGCQGSETRWRSAHPRQPRRSDRYAGEIITQDNLLANFQEATLKFDNFKGNHS